MLTLIALLLGVLHVAFFGVYLYLTWHHRYWQKRGLITARPVTLLGTYVGLFTGGRSFMHEVQDVYDKYKGKERAVGVFFTREPQILVLDPQLAHEVLVTNFSDFRDTISSTFVGYVRSDRFVIRNPFFTTGDDWKRRRTDIGGGLTSNKLKQAYAIWEQSGNKLLNYMEQLIEKEGNVIETRDLCYRYSADAMADFIWGIDAGTLTAGINASSHFQKVSSTWTVKVFSNFTLFSQTVIAPFVRKLFQLRFFPKQTDEFFLQLTADAVQMRLKSGSGAQRSDYLSHMVQLMEQKGATNDDLVGHALTVLLDGYETSTGVLYQMLYMLGEYPEVQQKLRAEIVDALAADKNISYEQLTTLPYLDQCVNESLRLSSIIGTLTKLCTKATTIDLDNGRKLQVEPGTSIMVPAYQFHNDASYYPEPEVFKPERFENGAHNECTKRGYFLPFGDGPRICLGMRLGLLNIKMALFRILSEYEVLQTKKVPKTADSVLGLYLNGDIELKYNKLNK
ncbi:probable cytochrome P450 309a1 [Scaptodrosophila lebanonensis]|uniref:Probable cytochrome P450 309a1 n=1 Tax=Drosophila lebanonensis TaxID=7225 RepID=A0A6J2U9M0_DROLE|nr:probable cytochrome P450 309a1 [Scaptodrosophila lebanonensis]